MSDISIKHLYHWCKILVEQLVNHPDLKIPFRLVSNSKEMGELMARDFAEEIKRANSAQRQIVQRT